MVCLWYVYGVFMVCLLCINYFSIYMGKHIELKHDWDYLIFMYLDFNTFNYYITSRKNIKIMIKIGFIRGQGKFGIPNQGYLFNINTYKKKKPIINEKSLIKFIKKS